MQARLFSLRMVSIWLARNAQSCSSRRSGSNFSADSGDTFASCTRLLHCTVSRGAEAQAKEQTSKKKTKHAKKSNLNS
eukprot:m.253441 g.253441  ORF g.253441 m.253441 type:complete len:78 (+) comp11000_c1_seq6:3751-3984(+)